jgi:hypothetical protein
LILGVSRQIIRSPDSRATCHEIPGVADVSKWTNILRAENLSHTFERDDSCVVGCLLKDAQAVATRLRSLDAPGQRRARRIPFRLICSKPNRSARTPWSAVLWPINQFLPSCKWLLFLPPQSGQPFRCEPFLVRLRTCGPIHELGPRVVADGLLRDHDSFGIMTLTTAAQSSMA